MAYEGDILAVGDESQSGDAIALRFGDFVRTPGNQTIVVIDGGFQDSGEKLVSRIQNEYGTSYVDLVISTHPDNDHISGLHVVLDKLSVRELWLHRPWHMSNSIKKLAEENRSLTTLGLSNKLKKSIESAYDLKKLAEKKHIPIKDPFQGENAFDNILHVLSPSKTFYQQLVTEFEKSASVSSVLEKVKKSISEVWLRDKLLEPDQEAVNTRNNSSVVLLAQFDGDGFLFTDDAGVIALNHAADYANANNYDLASRIRYKQIPHHGSKRNLGPSILNSIIGPIQPVGAKINKTAFVSVAAKGNPKHPSRRVTNALIRRGVTVTATCGVDHCFRSRDVPVRPDWGPITPLDFAYSFEEEE